MVVLFTRYDTVVPAFCAKRCGIIKSEGLLRLAGIKTTMRYAHLAPDESRAAGEALERQGSHLSRFGNSGEKVSTSGSANVLISLENMAPRDGLEPPTQ